MLRGPPRAMRALAAKLVLRKWNSLRCLRSSSEGCSAGRASGARLRCGHPLPGRLHVGTADSGGWVRDRSVINLCRGQRLRRSTPQRDHQPGIHDLDLWHHGLPRGAPEVRGRDAGADVTRLDEGEEVGAVGVFELKAEMASQQVPEGQRVDTRPFPNTSKDDLSETPGCRSMLEDGALPALVTF